LTCGQVSVDCFASVLASSLANSNASVPESAGTVAAAVEGGARRRGCTVRNGRSGRRASVYEHAEQRPCAVQLSLGGRGSGLGKVEVSVEVCVEGRAVGGGGGLRITAAGCQWDLGDGVAKIIHKRFSRCVGGNGIIHRGVSRLEGRCESHVIVTAAGVEGP
jgi:hypothetical protein